MKIIERPKLRVTRMDGNAFNLMGQASAVAKKAGWPKERIDAVMKECLSGNYHHLLQTLMAHFEVS